MSVFILFDEQQAIMAFANRGLTKTFPLGYNENTRPPMTGWECTNCGKLMKLENCEDGECVSCCSPMLDAVFGEEAFLEKWKNRKKRMKEISLRQAR